MEDSNKATSRRDFLKTTAAFSAAPLLAGSWSQVLGANDRIRVGMIGFGIRGSQLIANVFAEPNTEVVAVSDLYDGHLAHSLELAAGKSQPAPKTTKRYHEVLERKDVDAIVIAVPDFWHKQVCLDALAAGKDIYCEKPLLHKLDDGPTLISAVRDSGRMFQVGSQHVSSPHVIEAKKLIEAGQLGTITQIKATWDTNTQISAWQMPVPSDASEKTIDWETYLAQSPHKVPFDAKRFFSWRRYLDYGEGLAGDVLVHIITTIHYIMGVKTAPPNVMAAGGRYIWNDGRDVYDAISILAQYSDPNFFANYEANQDNQYLGQHIYILGSKGTMDLTFGDYKVYEENWPARWEYAVESWAKPQRDEFYTAHGMPLTPSRSFSMPSPPKVIAQSPKPDFSEYMRGFSPHMKSFMDAVRSRKQPVEDVEMGVEAATTAILGNVSWAERLAVRWDPKSRSILS